MEILLVSQFYFPNEPGGTETQNRALVEKLVSEGHNVTVLAFDGSVEKSVVPANGYRILRINVEYSCKFLPKIKNREFIGSFTILKSILSLKHYLELKKKMSLELKGFKPDVINFSGSFFIFNLYLFFHFFAKKFPNAKRILTIHDYVILGRKSTKDNKKQFILSSIKKYCIKRFIDKILVPSSHFCQKLYEDNLKNVEVVPNFTPDNLHVDSANEISGKIKIVYAGSVEKEKGLDWLTNSFKLLSKNNKNFELSIIGDGNYLDNVKSDLKGYDNVFFYGKIVKEKLLNFLHKVNIVILPSRFNETFGLILLEGYFSGALPMGSNFGALPELLNNENDLIFANNEELTLKLKNFLDEPDNILKMYKKLNSHFAGYQNTRILNKYISILKN